MQFIKYRVGNGQLVWVWYDNWHPLGPLKQRFVGRIIYDAGSTEKAKMCEYVNQNGWNMPHPVSSDLLAVVNQLPGYSPNVEEWWNGC